MTTSARRIAYLPDGNLDDPSDDHLSGHTVDALLASGDAEGARTEFERLCLEGLDSGEPIEMTPEKWDGLRQDLHRKAKLAL